MWIDVFWCVISLLNMMFRLSSREALIYKGLRVFLGEIVVIFGVVKSGGILDFSMFCRSGYRSGYLDGFWWNVSEMSILQGVCG